MERLLHSRFIYLLVTIILILTIIFLLLQVQPVVSGLFKLIKAVAIPFLIGVAIAYLLNPVVNLLNRRGVPRAIAVLIIYATFFLVLTVALLNAIPVVIKQARELSEYLPQLTRTYQKWLSEFQIHKYALPEGVQQGLEQGINRLEKDTAVRISTAVDSFPDKIDYFFMFAVIPFVVFYFLKDMKTMRRLTLSIVPARHRRTFTRLTSDIDHALGNYIRGQLTVCGIVGILAYVGYLVIGMKYALLLAFISGITNVIPYLGPFIGAAPAVLLALTVSWKMVLSVVIVNIIVQILEGNVVSPLVVGRKLHMHPLLIIFALLVGEAAGGILGMILAVPVLAVSKVILQYVVLHYVKH